jgi:hypothetical protein
MKYCKQQGFENKRLQTHERFDREDNKIVNSITNKNFTLIRIVVT